MASQLLARHWIDGEWDDARDRVESINPATGETIGAYTEAGEAEARRAIAAALKAFKKTDLRENRRLRAKVMAPSQAGSARSPDPETRGKTRRPL